MSQAAYKIHKINHEEESTFDSQNEVIMQMFDNEIAEGGSAITINKSSIEANQKGLETGGYEESYLKEHVDEARTILEKMLKDCGNDESVDYMYA